MTRHIKMKSTLIAITLIALSLSTLAGETYWLKNAATPLPGALDLNMLVVDTPETGVGVVAIEIRGDYIYLNKDLCSAEIKRIEPFYIDRGMNMLVDGVGGEKKFSSLIQKKLHSNMRDWKEIIRTKEASSTEGAGCTLISKQGIIKSKNELIIPFGEVFYRFTRGEDIKF